MTMRDDNIMQVTLNIDKNAGPYDMEVSEDSLRNRACFVVYAQETKEGKSDWIAAPLPKPLAEDGVLLRQFATEIQEDGYYLEYSPATVH